MILGEGAGIVVLEAPEHAARRGARAIATLMGGGMSNSPGSLLSCDPAGMIRAMERALADAGLPPDAIGYINAHGTGTASNDHAEGTAINHIFGTRDVPVPVSSIKSMIGHAMGAAGAIEAIATIAALESGLLPPTLHFLGIDPEIGIDPLSTGVRRQPIAAALSNSFAFGGIAVCLVFGRASG